MDLHITYDRGTVYVTPRELEVSRDNVNDFMFVIFRDRRKYGLIVRIWNPIRHTHQKIPCTSQEAALVCFDAWLESL